MPINHWPAGLQPREKLLAQGAESLSDTELLALFIHTGTKGMSAIDIAQHLLQQYHDIPSLLNAEQNSITQHLGFGKAKYALLQAALELGKRYTFSQIKAPQDLDGSNKVQDYLILKLRHLKHETFACLFLNSHFGVIEYQEMFRGGVDRVNVHAGEIAKSALKLDAAGVILAHNHPSGSAEPSKADIALTKSIKAALKTVEVDLIDHMIVAHSSCYSFIQHGKI